MQSTSDILIIIPAFNEAKTLRRLVAEVRKCSPQSDILIINDGSSDQTKQEAIQSGAFLVNLPFNLGIGGAVQTGLKFAERYDYKIAIQLDGDGQHDPRYVNQLTEPVVSGKADLVIGSRFLGHPEGFQSTAARRLGIRFFSKLLRALTGFSISDPTSGFRAFNQKAIFAFAHDYPVDFPEPESIILAKLHRLNVLEIPVKMRKRLGGISSIRSFKTFYYMIKVTLAILIDALRKPQRED